jgi:hypothetical protein
VNDEKVDGKSGGREPAAGGVPELPIELQRVVERITRRERERR